MPFLIGLFVVLLVIIFYFYLKDLSPRIQNPLRYENNPDWYRYYNTPDKWNRILIEKVPFYRKLSNEKKTEFELKIQKFFQDYIITGYNTDINISDKLLVAAAGVIPAFEFKNWTYENLDKIFILADNFNKKFETGKEDCVTEGMVKNNQMFLSKKTLHDDFINEKTPYNVAIHEFAHFIDFADNKTDGFPSKLLDNKMKSSWDNFILKTAKERSIVINRINDYAYKNPKEFFSVLCEYYFEQPQELKKNHPEAFQLLKKAFSSKMGSVFNVKHVSDLKPNNSCPCRSGKRFKNCCMEYYLADINN